MVEEVYPTLAMKAKPKSHPKDQRSIYNELKGLNKPSFSLVRTLLGGGNVQGQKTASALR